eukprot:EG_transcript_14037
MPALGEPAWHPQPAPRAWPAAGSPGVLGALAVIVALAVLAAAGDAPVSRRLWSRTTPARQVLGRPALAAQNVATDAVLYLRAVQAAPRAARRPSAPHSPPAPSPVTPGAPLAPLALAAVALFLGLALGRSWQSRSPRRARPAAALGSPFCAMATAAEPAPQPVVPIGSVTAILLAGGVGKRMGASIPKQYLELKGRPIATYSLATFAAMLEVGELVVVCNDEWRSVFDEAYATLPTEHQKPIKFALPGKERQDSVFNGFQAARPGAALVAIHDTARPVVKTTDVLRCLQDAMVTGAAVLGVPVKPTIKEVGKDGRVIRTLERAKLWEVQTPQCIQPDLLRRGFELVQQKNLEVTDDVSIIEALGNPVVVTPGSYSNLKITTPDDLPMAERFLELGPDA